MEKFVHSNIHPFTNIFQPIYNLKEMEIVGYESLMRTTMYKDIKELFQLAHEQEFLYELDTASIKNSLAQFKHTYWEDHVFLSVNIFPSTLGDAQFISFLTQLITELDFEPSRLVLEMNVLVDLTTLEQLKEQISLFQSFGIKIAIDELGKSTSSVVSLIELSPDMVKLDHYFSKDLASITKKQTFLISLLIWLEDKEIILEGLEAQEDVDKARALGIHYAQGYQLGHPEEHLNK
ncbi:hypothetical protein Q73_02960 [Bacillus coahuilensis m2-6]|uniref:EAL domain-containing protein n=1 Tax=Bacillus coahuilensis TaxID=408580 RepID=UPI0001850B6C|nr:EAL domain-containing protein [Bacillus coahuilensis]KUP09586.1 hypothetical protein Q73_02960 [Bacillus coahuilensis m2-6]